MLDLTSFLLVNMQLPVAQKGGPFPRSSMHEHTCYTVSIFMLHGRYNSN